MYLKLNFEASPPTGGTGLGLVPFDGTDKNSLQSWSFIYFVVLNLQENANYQHSYQEKFRTLGNIPKLAMNTIKKEHLDIQEMLMTLERNHVQIQQTLQKLNSYKCEPTCYEAFKRLQDLRDDIDRLKKEHLDLFQTIDLRQMTADKPVISKMRNQIQGFKELDRRIGIYLLDTAAAH